MPMPANVKKLPQNQLQPFLLASQQAARMGGEVLMKMLGKADTWEKGPGDLVTQADFQSQRVIRKYLLDRFPEHGFLGEEDETDARGFGSQPDKHSTNADSGKPSALPLATGEDFCWIVDPLDGTTNFVHQLPSFSVSIALRYQQQVLAGCVYDPTTDEMFSAAMGHGATLDGVPLHTSQCTALNQALVVFSMGSQVSREDLQTKRLLNVLEKAHTVRRLGSAALNLCLTACGRIDAYWATNLKTWDVAAGWLIAREAGAVLDTFDDQPLRLDRPRFCCAATRELFEEMKLLLQIPE